MTPEEQKPAQPKPDEPAPEVSPRLRKIDLPFDPSDIDQMDPETLRSALSSVLRDLQNPEAMSHRDHRSHSDVVVEELRREFPDPT